MMMASTTTTSDEETTTATVPTANHPIIVAEELVATMTVPQQQLADNDDNLMRDLEAAFIRNNHNADEEEMVVSFLADDQDETSVFEGYSTHEEEEEDNQDNSNNNHHQNVSVNNNDSTENTHQTQNPEADVELGVPLHDLDSDNEQDNHDDPEEEANEDDDPSTTTTTTAAAAPVTVRFLAWKWIRIFLHVVLFPLLVITSVAIPVVIVMVCFALMFIAMVVLLCVYYCCSPRRGDQAAVPFHVLIRQILEAVEDETGGHDGTLDTPKYTRQEIQNSLVRRKLVHFEITDADGNIVQDEETMDEATREERMHQDMFPLILATNLSCSAHTDKASAAAATAALEEEDDNNNNIINNNNNNNNESSSSTTTNRPSRFRGFRRRLSSPRRKKKNSKKTVEEIEHNNTYELRLAKRKITFRTDPAANHSKLFLLKRTYVFSAPLKPLKINPSSSNDENNHHEHGEAVPITDADLSDDDLRNYNLAVAALEDDSSSSSSFFPVLPSSNSESSSSDDDDDDDDDDDASTSSSADAEGEQNSEHSSNVSFLIEDNNSNHNNNSNGDRQEALHGESGAPQDTNIICTATLHRVAAFNPLPIHEVVNKGNSHVYADIPPPEAFPATLDSSCGKLNNDKSDDKLGTELNVGVNAVMDLMETGRFDKPVVVATDEFRAASTHSQTVVAMSDTSATDTASNNSVDAPNKPLTDNDNASVCGKEKATTNNITKDGEVLLRVASPTDSDKPSLSRIHLGTTATKLCNDTMAIERLPEVEKVGKKAMSVPDAPRVPADVDLVFTAASLEEAKTELTAALSTSGDSDHVPTETTTVDESVPTTAAGESAPSSQIENTNATNDAANTNSSTSEDSSGLSSQPVTVQEPEHRGISSYCNICLLEYEVGDIVVWSRRPNGCHHAWHEACLLDWLKRKPTCPNCRQEYFDIEDAPEQVDNGDNNDDSEEEEGINTILQESVHTIPVESEHNSRFW